MFMGPVLVPLTHSTLRRLVGEATPRDLHLALSAATRGAVSMGRPLISRLPLVGLCFVFPGVSNEEQPWALSWGWGMRKTWPSQRQPVAYWWSPILYTSQFFIRDDVWPVYIEETSKAFGLEDFEFSQMPQISSSILVHIRTLRTLLLKILILVWLLSPVDLHMDFNMAKAWLALLILVWCVFVSLQLWWLCFPGMWIPQRPLVVCYSPVFCCSWWCSYIGPESV